MATLHGSCHFRRDFLSHPSSAAQVQAAELLNSSSSSSSSSSARSLHLHQPNTLPSSAWLALQESHVSVSHTPAEGSGSYADFSGALSLQLRSFAHARCSCLRSLELVQLNAAQRWTRQLWRRPSPRWRALSASCLSSTARCTSNHRRSSRCAIHSSCTCHCCSSSARCVSMRVVCARGGGISVCLRATASVALAGSERRRAACRAAQLNHIAGGVAGALHGAGASASRVPHVEGGLRGRPGGGGGECRAGSAADGTRHRRTHRCVERRTLDW
jgi:hypothetical protein